MVDASIVVQLDEHRTHDVGGGKDGAIHTYYFHCRRGILRYDCAVSALIARTRRDLSYDRVQDAAEHIARERADAEFDKRAG